MGSSAEREFGRIATKASADVARLGSHSVLLEATMRIILKKELLDDLVTEIANAPTDERDRLQAAVHELEGRVNLLERQLQDANAKLLQAATERS